MNFNILVIFEDFDAGENIKLFDISKIFVKKSNFPSIKCSKYVENGISFRGLDV